MISDYFLLTAISIQLSMFLSLTKCSDWDYHQNGPDVWQDFDQMCASSSQSPINIKTVCAVYKSFNQFNFSETYNISQNFSLNFNKHSINGSLIDQEEYPLHLTGGGLNGIYKFVNFHLHWGENYASGSEHEVYAFHRLNSELNLYFFILEMEKNSLVKFIWFIKILKMDIWRCSDFLSKRKDQRIQTVLKLMNEEDVIHKKTAKIRQLSGINIFQLLRR